MNRDEGGSGETRKPTDPEGPVARLWVWTGGSGAERGPEEGRLALGGKRLMKSSRRMQSPAGQRVASTSLRASEGIEGPEVGGAGAGSALLWGEKPGRNLRLTDEKAQRSRSGNPDELRRITPSLPQHSARSSWVKHCTTPQMGSPVLQFPPTAWHGRPTRCEVQAGHAVGPAAVALQTPAWYCWVVVTRGS
jgi:hypothetical protein